MIADLSKEKLCFITRYRRWYWKNLWLRHFLTPQIDRCCFWLQRRLKDSLNQYGHILISILEFSHIQTRLDGVFDESRVKWSRD